MTARTKVRGNTTMGSRTVTVILLSLLILPHTIAQARIIHVDKRNTSGIENGTRWRTAFTKLQDAIDAAVAGDELWVAEGVYDEQRSSIVHNPEIETGSLLLKANVELYGGFQGIETQRDERDFDLFPTVIDGQTSRNGEPAYHTIYVGYRAVGAVLDGFVIMGTEEPLESLNIHERGDAIYTVVYSMTIHNCEFIGRDGGSGLYSAGETFVEDCTFSNLSPGIEGYSLLQVSNSEFDSCSNAISFYPGFGSNVMDSRFTNCTSQYYGGAIEGFAIRLWRCEFINNSAGLAGGAVYMTQYARVEDCLFKNNTVRIPEEDEDERTVARGGALFIEGDSALIRNSVFYNNHADEGSAIYAKGWFSYLIEVQMYQSTIAANGPLALYDGGASIWSSSVLLSDNPLPEIARPPFARIGGFGFDHSIVREIPEDAIDYEGNITGEVDPMFLDLDNGDLRITDGSPAIDAAFSEYGPDHDILGTPRPISAGYDIGAYEFDPDNPPTLPEEPATKQDTLNKRNFPPCFIATAAYGTPMAQEIQPLRTLPDDHLLTNPLGHAFTDTYYRLSPPLAHHIARHELVRAIVRAGICAALHPWLLAVVSLAVFIIVQGNKTRPRRPL